MSSTKQYTVHLLYQAQFFPSGKHQYAICSRKWGNLLCTVFMSCEIWNCYSSLRTSSTLGTRSFISVITFSQEKFFNSYKEINLNQINSQSFLEHKIIHLYVIMLFPLIKKCIIFIYFLFRVSKDHFDQIPISSEF